MGGVLSLTDYLPTAWYRRFFGYTTKKTFSFAAKSKDQLVQEFNGLDEASGSYFYSQIINEIKDAVLQDDLDRFQMLSELLTYVHIHKNQETVANYQQTAHVSTGNINLIILACKSSAVNVLMYLFSDNNCFYKVPFAVDRSDLLPEEDDEHHHNAFYYAIRSNNCELLEILIDKWPNDCLKENSDKLDGILSKAYKDLMIKNVGISKSMELYVESKLVDLRFFHERVVQKTLVPDPGEIKNLKDLTMLRMDFVLEKISYVREHFSNSDPNELFILSAEYIAKNIHTLKAVIKSKRKLPWEEMEFCLIIFIRSCRCRFQKYPLYNFLLNKQRVLTHLGNFSEVLTAVKEQVKTGNINKYRIIVIKGLDYLENHTDFKALNEDFTQVRDLYTLETIRKSTMIAVSADISEKHGQYLITRALQIIGEHFKNTLASPNLSNATYELFLSDLPENVKDIVTDLRDCLSHAESLATRPESKENVISFFSSIQSDVEQLDMIISDFLCRKKVTIIGKMLDKIKECGTPISIKLFLERNHFSPSSFTSEMEEVSDFAVGYMEKLETRIVKFQRMVEEGLKVSKELFHQLYDAAFKYSSRNQTDVSKFFDFDDISLRSDVKETIKVFSSSLLESEIISENIENKNGEVSSDVETIPLQRTDLLSDNEELYKVLGKILFKNRWNELKFSYLRIRDYAGDLDTAEMLTFENFEDNIPIKEVEISECEKVISNLVVFSSDILNWATEQFRKIYSFIEEEKYRLKGVREDFCYALAQFMKMASFENHCHHFYQHDNHYDRFDTSIKSHVSRTERKFRLLATSNMKIFREELIKILDDIRDKIVGKNYIRELKKSKDCSHILMNIMNFAVFRMKQVRGIQEYKHILMSIEKHKRTKPHRIISKKGNEGQLSHRFSILKRAIGNFQLETLTTEKLKFCEKDSKLQHLIEMFVLDVMSALEAIPNRVSHNVYFLDTDYPVVNGKNLRNHLAHGNALISIILRSDMKNVLLNARKLIEIDDRLRPDQQIGQKMQNDPVKLKASHDEDLTAVHMQRELFLALTEGDMERVQDSINRGADLLGRDLNSQTSLHFAAKGSHLEIVKFVLKSNIDMNFQDEDGQTVLHIAASNGRLSMVEFLLQDMTMPTDECDILGKTPLHCASQNGHLDVVESLLKHNADTIAKDRFGLAPLHYAVNGNFIDIVDILLKNESTVDANKTSTGNSALHLASERGHFNIVLDLINKKGNVNFLTDLQFTPLHFAASYGHTDVTELLIAKGADVNAVNIHKASPLHLAVQNGFKEIVHILLNSGANVNAVDTNGLTPLSVAAVQGNLLIAKILIDHEAICSTSTECGMCPLILAASFGHYEFVNLLMVKYNFNTDTKILAFLEASLSGHRLIMEFLVNEGVSIHAKWVCAEFTALHLAAIKGHTDVVDFLIEKGCDIDAKTGGIDSDSVSSCNAEEYFEFFNSSIFERSKRGIVKGNGQTALHISVIGGHRETVRSLLRNKANYQIKDNSDTDAFSKIILNGMADIIIEENVDVRLVECENYTPLHLGSCNGGLKFVQYCIKEGCDIEARDKQNGYTALHLAVVNNNLDVVNHLLENGSNIDAITNDDFTSLKIAIFQNKKNIFDILIGRNAKFDAKEEREFMIKAIENGNEEIVEYFLSKNPKSGTSNLDFDYYPLHEAVIVDRLNIVKKLVQALDEGEIDAKYEEKTPLCLAVINNRCEIAKFLLSKGADPIGNAEEEDGAPLAAAVSFGLSEMVKILLERGADSFRNDASEFSLMLNCFIATRFGYLDVLEILLTHLKVDVNHQFSSTSTLLHYAALYGSLDIVRYLVDLEADVNATNSEGTKPIHLAAREGHESIVDYLLSQKIEIDDRGANGFTLLHYAAYGNHPDLCEFLIKEGLDVNIEDGAGNTALHVAAAIGKTNAFRALLENGACCDPIKIIRKMEHLNSLEIFLPLTRILFMFAVVRDNDCSALNNLLKEAEECSKVGYVNVRDEENLTLLHYAAMKCSADIVELLLKHKANPNVKDSEGRTPLHYAVTREDFADIEEIFRKYKPNQNVESM